MSPLQRKTVIKPEIGSNPFTLSKILALGSKIFFSHYSVFELSDKQKCLEKSFNTILIIFVSIREIQSIIVLITNVTRNESSGKSKMLSCQQDRNIGKIFQWGHVFQWRLSQREYPLHWKYIIFPAVKEVGGSASNEKQMTPLLTLPYGIQKVLHLL